MAQRVADSAVDLPAGGADDRLVTHRFDTPGEHVVEVRLADDALPLDNHRWLSVPVRESDPRAVPSARPARRNATRALALEPRKQQDRGAVVVVEAAGKHARWKPI